MTERLWAPWRAAYIQASSRARGKHAGATACIFCELPAQKRDRANLILRRARRTFVMLNRYPYNNGHLLVAPYAHVPSLEDLAPAAAHELMDEVRGALARVRGVMKPDGFNVGLNLGLVAGAGFADHVHVHVVPRWSGDTNFMPVIGGVRVISQDLEDTRRALEPAFARGSRRASRP